MIAKAGKTFRWIQYVSQNEYLDKENFKVKDIAWLHFGYGERINHEGQLQLQQGATLRPEKLSLSCTTGKAASKR